MAEAAAAAAAAVVGSGCGGPLEDILYSSIACLGGRGVSREGWGRLSGLISG